MVAGISFMYYDDFTWDMGSRGTNNGRYSSTIMVFCQRFYMGHGVKRHKWWRTFLQSPLLIYDHEVQGFDQEFSDDAYRDYLKKNHDSVDAEGFSVFDDSENEESNSPVHPMILKTRGRKQHRWITDGRHKARSMRAEEDL